MERDEESGLEYHSARYYSPWLGRWVSSDSIGIKDGVNLYSYTANNPIHRIDSRGTFWCVIPVIAGVYLLEGCSSNRLSKPIPKITGNYVLIAGGTSVNDPKRHDKSAMNFIQAAALRVKDIKRSDPSAKITVIMYSPDDLSYQKRAKTEGKDKFHYEKIMIDSAKRLGYELVIIKKDDELTLVLNTASVDRLRNWSTLGIRAIKIFILNTAQKIQLYLLIIGERAKLRK